MWHMSILSCLSPSGEGLKRTLHVFSPSLFSHYEMSKCYRIFSVLRNTILFPWKILWGQLILAIWRFKMSFTRHQFRSVAESCPTLCNPMDCSTPGLPVHHRQLPEFTQTHVHQVGDAIQPSHPLLSPSPPAFNLSQHQGLFKWVSPSHQVAILPGIGLEKFLNLEIHWKRN